MKMKKAKRNMAIGYVIVMIPLLVLPLLIQSRADMGLINNALLLYIVSLGLNISLGLTGMSNLCQAAFWGTGAYTAAILVTKFGLPFLVVVPVSVIVTAFVSMLLGLLSTRIKGIYFAILTIGFALFFSLVLQNWPEVTGGGTGLRGIGDPNFIFFSVTSRKGLYFGLLRPLHLVLQCRGELQVRQIHGRNQVQRYGGRAAGRRYSEAEDVGYGSERRLGWSERCAECLYFRCGKPHPVHLRRGPDHGPNSDLGWQRNSAWRCDRLGIHGVPAADAGTAPVLDDRHLRCAGGCGDHGIARWPSEHPFPVQVFPETLFRVYEEAG